jgi:hypothetical protein
MLVRLAAGESAAYRGYRGNKRTAWSDIEEGLGLLSAGRHSFASEGNFRTKTTLASPRKTRHLASIWVGGVTVKRLAEAIVHTNGSHRCRQYLGVAM